MSENGRKVPESHEEGQYRTFRVLQVLLEYCDCDQRRDDHAITTSEKKNDQGACNFTTRPGRFGSADVSAACRCLNPATITTFTTTTAPTPVSALAQSRFASAVLTFSCNRLPPSRPPRPQPQSSHALSAVTTVLLMVPVVVAASVISFSSFSAHVLKSGIAQMKRKGTLEPRIVPLGLNGHISSSLCNLGLGGYNLLAHVGRKGRGKLSSN